MPFIIIELPQAVHFELHSFAGGIHQYLSEFFATPIEKFKTKVIRLPEVYVGNGDPKNMYAHITVKLMTGRDKQKLVVAVNELLKMFTAALTVQNPEVSLRITAEFSQMDREIFVSAQ